MHGHTYIYIYILDKDGNPPPGHKGKKQKALDTWKANKAAKNSQKVNSLGVEGEDTENDDDELSDGWEQPMRVFAIRECPPKEQVATHNKYEALASGSEDQDKPDDLECLNNFAHYIQRGKKLPQRKARVVNSVKIQSVKDMHRAKHFMHALPTDKESLDRIAKLCPTNSEKLGKSEIWVMADTGSTLKGMDVRKELPEYAKLVKPIPNRDRGAGAETACGARVQIDGEISLTGHIDDNLHTIIFKDMNVTMPIASMIQAVKKGNTLTISEDGGTITNRATGKVVRLHERQGVYFFKMKLLPTQSQSRYTHPSKSGFIRPA